jgi:ABC-type phosphate/phosphonate transport system ATPase subunit
LQDFDLKSLEPVAVLGAGGFGRVTLVRCAEQYLALKQMSKAYIVEQRLTAHVHREKKVGRAPGRRGGGRQRLTAHVYREQCCSA